MVWAYFYDMNQNLFSKSSDFRYFGFQLWAAQWVSEIWTSPVFRHPKIVGFWNIQILDTSLDQYIKKKQIKKNSDPPPPHRAISVKTVHQLIANNRQNCGLWVN